MLMCDICKSFNINYIRVRVSKSLDVNCFCIFLNCILNFFQIENVNKCCCNSIIRKCMLKKVERSSINILCRYDVISLLSQILNCICDCCCTGCYCKCRRTAFKRCDSFLEYIFSRVCKTSVNVTCICKSETCSCMIAVSEYIRRCLIDWYCSCICNRIRTLLSYVKL